jgi:hypothetical protein
MHYQYGGLSYTLEAGKRRKVEEAIGNHVLNALGARGMTKLVYDEDGKSIDEDQNARDAIQRLRDFKERQIVVYNERNERRKSQNQAYDMPTDTVKRYAAELGIELLKPYTLATAEKGQIGKLTFENEQLKIQMSEMMKKMTEFMGQDKPEAVPEGSVKCDVCGDIVLEKRFKSHLNYKHSIKDDG